MNKRKKTLTTDDEKREFMGIFDHIFNDWHERTLKELETINKHMWTRIENFDELNINVDTIVSDEVRKQTEINNKWKFKEKLIAEQIEATRK